MSGFVGSTRIWLKYIGRPFSFERNSQLMPLSFERQMPLYCGSGGSASSSSRRIHSARSPSVRGSSLSAATSICA